MTLQPSLGSYYAHVNQEWRKGYEVHTSQSGHYISGPKLEHIVVVSISGGINDFQVLFESYFDTFNGNCYMFKTQT